MAIGNKYQKIFRDNALTEEQIEEIHDVLYQTAYVLVRRYLSEGQKQECSCTETSASGINTQTMEGDLQA